MRLLFLAVGKLKIEIQKKDIKTDPAEHRPMASAPPAPPGPPAPSILAVENQPPPREEKLPSPKEKKKESVGGGEKEENKSADTPKAKEKEKEKAMEEKEKKRKEEEEAAAEGERKKNLPIKLGEEELNCGVKSSCSESSISARLFTGRQANELPRICINGR